MKRLKAVFIVLALVILTFSLTACGPDSGSTDKGDNGGAVVGGDSQTGGGSGAQTGGTTGVDNGTQTGGTQTGGGADATKILVAYFSCTNNTKGRAEALQSRLDADIYRIVPAVAYTAADLNYNTDCRANREQNDRTARPQISGRLETLSQYDVIYLGYPIWWGQAPKIIYTFLESYDFGGVTVIPFCTSGSSGMGSSATNLHASAPDAIWKSGRRVSSNSDIDALVNMR